MEDKYDALLRVVDQLRSRVAYLESVTEAQTKLLTAIAELIGETSRKVLAEK